MSLFHRLVVAGLPLVPKILVGKVASRYVAGETRDDALAAIEELNGEGVLATIDVLGEAVHEESKARAAVEEYIRLFDEIQHRGLDANVSIKLTLLGLEVDESFCRDNVERIAAAAREHGNFVRIDMEDHPTHDATFRIYRELQTRYGNLGVVLQAYMRRILDDIAALPEGANVRLCKGIYIESRQVAWKGYETVRLNFVAALDKLIQRGIYPAIATHDEYLVAAAVHRIDRRGLPRDGYEFQMLLGVEERLRRILVEAGHRVRVYVPYGRDWYPYSVRRLRENPQVAGHVLRALLRREGRRGGSPGRGAGR
jgi:proline dehydrogenase